MCLESLVAIMAMIAACTLDPGVYLAMNVKGAGATPAAIALDTKARVEAPDSRSSPRIRRRAERSRWCRCRFRSSRCTASPTRWARDTLFGRTGGAATLAVGMAQIFSKLTRGRWLDLWYHFALMFEALFILTTLDAGTRVGRYLLQDALGHVWKPLGDTKIDLGRRCSPALLVVAGWGSFLIMGVRDPDGGVKALWPIFGIANQLLAASRSASRPRFC